MDRPENTSAYRKLKSEYNACCKTVEVLESKLKSLKCCGNCKDYMTSSENCLHNWPNGDGCDNWSKRNT